MPSRAEQSRAEPVPLHVSARGPLTGIKCRSAARFAFHYWRKKNKAAGTGGSDAEQLNMVRSAAWLDFLCISVGGSIMYHGARHGQTS